ncbi:hypothetical protein TcYC6_0026070 [Trypanosoma cruzi]|nr:hypothetical protein TcYC6_0026070 [Trypanosoma cruzi]
MGDTAIDDERLTFEALGAGPLQRFSFRTELPIKKKLSEESVVKTSKKDEMKKNKGADDAAALLRVGTLTECGGGGIECDKIPVAADKERSVSTTRGGEREERAALTRARSVLRGRKGAVMVPVNPGRRARCIVSIWVRTGRGHDCQEISRPRGTH